MIYILIPGTDYENCASFQFCKEKSKNKEVSIIIFRSFYLKHSIVSTCSLSGIGYKNVENYKIVTR